MTEFVKIVGPVDPDRQNMTGSGILIASDGPNDRCKKRPLLVYFLLQLSDVFAASLSSGTGFRFFKTLKPVRVF